MTFCVELLGHVVDEVASCRYVQYMPRLLLPYLPNLHHTPSALVNIHNCSHSLRAAILGA
jgi:hypothetical protein